jgi:predicted acyl esterase
MTTNVASGGDQPNARAAGLELENSHNPPPGYDPPIVCAKIAEQRDVMVPMRDGKRLCVDIYRPDMDGRFPALLAIAPHNRNIRRRNSPRPRKATSRPGRACGSAAPKPATPTVW